MTEATSVPFPPVDGTQPCAAEDPELFFPKGSRESTYMTPRALEVCTSCPFRRPCLAYALVWDVQGIWGGTTRDRRNQLRATHGITGRSVRIHDDEAVDVADDVIRGAQLDEEAGGVSADAESSSTSD